MFAYPACYEPSYHSHRSLHPYEVEYLRQRELARRQQEVEQAYARQVAYREALARERKRQLYLQQLQEQREREEWLRAHQRRRQPVVYYDPSSFYDIESDEEEEEAMPAPQLKPQTLPKTQSAPLIDEEALLRAVILVQQAWRRKRSIKEHLARLETVSSAFDKLKQDFTSPDS